MTEDILVKDQTGITDMQLQIYNKSSRTVQS